MGKYLTNFKTKEEYEAFREGDQYLLPNVSFIETNGLVINDSYQAQEKTVEITENGEITIAPDAGFAYLNKVSVKTNVAGSGGGGESNDVEYISFKDELGDEALSVIASLSLSVRLELEEGGIIARLVVPTFTYAKQLSQQMPSAVKFNRNEKMNMLIGMDGSGNPIIQSFTAVEYLGLMGQAFIDKFNSLPRIAKEEFYAL